MSATYATSLRDAANACSSDQAALRRRLQESANALDRMTEALREALVHIKAEPPSRPSKTTLEWMNDVLDCYGSKS